VPREPENSQLALDYVFARCQADPACHRAFPHLAAEWAALWASLGKAPWVLPAAQSPTGTTQLRLPDRPGVGPADAVHLPANP